MVSQGQDVAGDRGLQELAELQRGMAQQVVALQGLSEELQQPYKVLLEQAGGCQQMWTCCDCCAIGSMCM